ncbi:MAG: ParB/RepB/Spo0J family partition protein [Alphaproteobacteria bacterium]|nr:ParB/RepB/Spo0J family partition protein [Alphaproteobacteria bacterium]
MAKFGLGRGLDDLEKEIGDVPNMSILTGAERVVVRKIPLSQIGANPNQPRKTFSDDELSDLAASIREKGVITPILLRSVAGKPYMYEIVAGERRFRASKLAGKTDIPAIIKTITNENAMEIALIENVQRENLNPIEEANAYKNLMEQCHYELADVVRLIGKSESYIRNSIRLTELPASVQKMVQDGDISASHARTIVVADDPEKLAHEIKDKKLSVAATDKLVHTTKRSAKSRTYVSHTIDSKTLKSMEQGISTAIGAPVKIIEKRGGAGQIVLSFASRNELHELVKKLIQK